VDFDFVFGPTWFVLTVLLVEVISHSHSKAVKTVLGFVIIGLGVWLAYRLARRLLRHYRGKKTTPFDVSFDSPAPHVVTNPETLEALKQAIHDRLNSFQASHGNPPLSSVEFLDQRGNDRQVRLTAHIAAADGSKARWFYDVEIHLGGGTATIRPRLVQVLATRTASPTLSSTMVCPDCAETILAAASVCKHCGYRFAPPAA
jgi:hypothetical protein